MKCKLLNFKLRKLVHYSLFLCILLIQVIIAIFFYNEVISGKNMKFIKDQLVEIRHLEEMTDNSRKDFISLQEHFQNYIATQDNKELQLYFQSLQKLKVNFNKIERCENTNPKLKKCYVIYHKDTVKATKLKSLIDSVYHISLNPPDNIKNKVYIPSKFNKESTVITITNNKPLDISQVNSKMNNTIRSIDKHYASEIKKVQLLIAQDQKKDLQIYSSFSKLLVYSNKLIEVYDNAIKVSKAILEKEYNQQSSDNNKIRNYLIVGLMFLMFIVSILIMYLTSLAFIYEQKVNAAHKEIKNNLNFKNRILGMLSHDLRSPLKIINIFIDKTHRSTEDRTIKEYLKSIKFINSTLLLQSNQILEYTKNENTKKELIKTTFNLKDEICSIIKVIKPYLETRNNKLVVTNKIPEMLMVYSDNIRVNQIFMNILGNANKFTKDGQINLVVYTERLEDNKIMLISTISDTGIGISETDFSKIFDPYYRGAVSDEVDNLGVGLGLSLVKENIELFDGIISVESKLHKGTKVTFRINLNCDNNENTRSK